MSARTWKIRVLLAAGAVVASVDDAEPETRAFDLTGAELTIAKDNGDLDVRFGDTGGVEVTRWFAGDPADATWELRNDALRLATHCGGLFNSCAVRYEILVPRKTALTISGDNGPIEVEEPTADLTMATTSGALRATGITSGPVEAKSENGSVALAFTEAPDDIAVTTDNGAVTVDGARSGVPGHDQHRERR